MPGARLRHLRVRRGKPEGGQGSDNIGGNPAGQVIVDHCSTSWGMDENLSLSGGTSIYSRVDLVEGRVTSSTTYLALNYVTTWR